jgi:hypothetical protein
MSTHDRIRKVDDADDPAVDRGSADVDRDADADADASSAFNAEGGGEGGHGPAVDPFAVHRRPAPNRFAARCVDEAPVREHGGVPADQAEDRLISERPELRAMPQDRQATANAPRRAGGGGDGAVVRRWECRCESRPMLLATIDRTGRVNIKLRDRYFRVTGGRIEATCPRCGVLHVLAERDLA